jgi:hypothetical protein
MQAAIHGVYLSNRKVVAAGPTVHTRRLSRRPMHPLEDQVPEFSPLGFVYHVMLSTFLQETPVRVIGPCTTQYSALPWKYPQSCMLRPNLFTSIRLRLHHE